MLQEFRFGDTDAANSWNLDEEQNGISISVMNVADEAKIVVDERGLIWRIIVSSINCPLPISRERLLVLPALGRYRRRGIHFQKICSC